MRNNIFLILMVTVIVITIWSFSPLTYAMEKRPSSKKRASTKQATIISKAVGKVTSCSLRNSTVTISTTIGTSLVIRIYKNTSLTKESKNIKLADIKIGDVISVSYEAKKGVNIAKSISVREGATSTSAPMKKRR